MNPHYKGVIAGLIIAAGSLCSSSHADAQPRKISEASLAGQSQVTIVPGQYYKAGALHRLIFGDHWRSLWTSPMQVDVLDLRSFAGGLKPVETGGGFQTVSLRFMGKDGRQYRFRTVDKDPARGMPEKLHNTLISDIVQDQVSTANPVGGTIIAPFLRSAGILHSESQFVVMPYDREGLGEFYDEFAGLFGTIEEHPDENSGGDSAFGGADKVVSSYGLLDRLDADHDNVVDAQVYLKARLIDLFVGDWDRHSGQWRWAGYKNGEKTLWKPVPKDRDNAFSRQDGLFSWVITQIIPQIEGFGDDYGDVYFLSWSGRSLDRRIFPAVSHEEWQQAALQLQSILTDELIESSVARMPSAMYEKEGARFEHALKSRRDLLVEAAEELYGIYAGEVDIHASDKAEYARVDRHRDGTVEVSLYPYDPQKNVYEQQDRFYHRIFDPSSTEEIRLYMLGGDDIVRIEGTRTQDIDLRVIGGKGGDDLADNVRTSKDAGYNSALNYLYDSGKKTLFTSGPYTLVDRRHVVVPDEPAEKYDLKKRDYGSEVVASVANLKVDYAPEYGVFLGWGVIFEDYGFQRDPYNYNMEFSGGVAAGSGDDLRYKLEYTGDFRSVVDGASLMIEAGTTGLDIINFYGLGNETAMKPGLDEDDYEIRQQVSWFRPTLHFPANSNFQFRTGLEVRYIDLEVESGSELDIMNPYGVDEDFSGSFLVGLRYDSRDCGNDIGLSPRKQMGRLAKQRNTCATNALSGMYLDVEGQWFPEFAGNGSSFGKVSGEWRGYLPLGALPYSRLAVRAGGEKVWGDFPFYEAAYIGGARSIRGYDRERFAGDASLYAGSELRLYLGTFKLFVPIMFGPLAFVETGRVYLDGEDSDRWHTGYGGGMWFGFVEPRYSLSVSVGKGVDSGSLSDDYGIYVTTGFTF
ncbi:conserved hypothetical protein [Prosthecochloris aestuarii DSM 271]|uniref:Bacterial surface antigen (D15) domain-containing protein n=1 Tax=Prosthecochloris aestuarii (strain DSM 271 / SK 413) TaxID=290512 RepID=B4S7D9_PROA2|nr:BamA/TamA family outer membrane protein [Prosthecochloris aestuarii]ACF45976.1 conserved hypothetical protein [Prosthecochloris aestuarii DSM 271]